MSEPVFTPTAPTWSLHKQVLCFFSAPVLLVLIVLCLEHYAKQAIPVSAQDWNDISLLSPVWLEFSGLGWAFAIAASLVGSTVAINKAQIRHVYISLPVALFLALSTNPNILLRQMLVSDEAKIGCYTFNSRECREMLKLPVANAPSRLTESQGMYADWYIPIVEAAKAEVKLPAALPIFGIPSIYIQAEHTKAKMAQQREVLAKLRAAAK